ncbi:putative protein E4 [human papillomavirus 74]|uniref:Uncharacterized protein E4 n=1 Tax=Human papillomavirus type 74 TaxID=44028 RepID=Q8B5W6_HPV74|nr:putative protein E4 [human papillomavirus 74]
MYREGIKHTTQILKLRLKNMGIRCSGKCVLAAQLYVLLHLYLVLCKTYPLLGLLHTPPPPPLHRPPQQCPLPPPRITWTRRPVKDPEDVPPTPTPPTTPTTPEAPCVSQTETPWTVQTTTSSLTITTITKDGTTVTVELRL